MVKIFKAHPDAIIPEMHSTEAAGYDLHTINDFSLYPGERFVADTGLVVQPPEGYHTEILLRSGLAYKNNIVLINGVGLIDRDYSGFSDTLKVMLYRLPLSQCSGIPGLVDPHGIVSFKKGERIAQMVFRKTERFQLEEIFEAPKGMARGGLGSTGK